MKSNVMIVFKKELARFFGDKRLLLSSVLLPGIMIYLIYSFMGSAMSNMFETKEGYRYSVAVVNMPDSVSAMADGFPADFTVRGPGDLSEEMAAIEEKTLDLLAVFPPDFDAAVAAYDPASGEPAPNIDLFFNGTKTESSAAYDMMTAALDAYESSLSNKFDINALKEIEGAPVAYNLASEKDTSGFAFSSLLPMLLMVFLFSGCMAVAPEAIAGEKERGTIATMLITPAKRSELVMGKILALAVMALLSGASSILGTLLSLPKIMGGAQSMSAAYYGPADYALLAAVALSTVLLLVSVISIISAFAKTVKEAQTSVMPLMVVVMLIGVTGMFSSGAQVGKLYYLIPVYNSVQSMVGIFSFNAATVNVLITVLANLLLSAVSGLLLTKMFNSEKIMFNK